MPLTEKQVQHVCLAHVGARTCRYLENDKKNWRLHHCVKKVSGKKRAIDKEVAKYLADCKANHSDPKQGWKPIGDGGTCQGYAYLPTVLQGYDMSHQNVNTSPPKVKKAKKLHSHP